MHYYSLYEFSFPGMEVDYSVNFGVVWMEEGKEDRREDK